MYNSHAFGYRVFSICRLKPGWSDFTHWHSYCYISNTQEIHIGVDTMTNTNNINTNKGDNHDLSNCDSSRVRDTASCLRARYGDDRVRELYQSMYKTKRK